MVNEWYVLVNTISYINMSNAMAIYINSSELISMCFNIAWLPDPVATLILPYVSIFRTGYQVFSFL